MAVQDTSTGSATDLQGRYQLTGLQPGAYDLVFSYVGYQTKNVTDVEVQLMSISRAQGSGGLNPLPQSGGPAFSNLTSYPSSFYEDVGYVGAFGDTNWAKGWTYLDAAGYFAD